jgi:hypothetical protein
MTHAELGAYIQTYLRNIGIDIVLSGGAAVAIYTSGKYVSKDLDLVNRYLANRKAIKLAMEELGFVETGRHFEHPDSEYFVDFPPGPLSIGEKQIRRINEITTHTGVLKVISPTDCVKDRLAWYYHFEDRQCLNQAILVSRDNPVDLEEIRSWSEEEGKSDEFQHISTLLSS